MKGLIRLATGMVYALSTMAAPAEEIDASSANEGKQSSSYIASLIAAGPHMVGTYNVTDAIVRSVNQGINFPSLNVSLDAMKYIKQLVQNGTATATRRNTNPRNGIDVHSHLVLPWYRELVPTTGGETTPDWSTASHLAFAAQEGVAHSVLANGAPQANVFMGDQVKTIAMARLLNICVAVIVKLDPNHFDFFGVVPLPYASAAATEAAFVLDYLGAVGITATTNHEGLYLGNPQITPFFKYMNSRGPNQIIYVHPTAPYHKIGNNFVEFNPTVYMTGLVEFYFETARCLMDLTYSQTLMNFTNIKYISAHVGGAFPSILDRMIKSVPQLEASAKAIYSSRIWWDSAGPTYPEQVRGLLGYGIPVSQLVFGTDYPYAPPLSYAGALAGFLNDPDFNQAAINQIMNNNTANLFKGKLHPF